MNEYAMQRENKKETIVALLINLSADTLAKVKYDMHSMVNSGMAQFWAECVDEAAMLNKDDKPTQQLTHVESAVTENTGGGTMVDVITLKSGKVVTISNDVLCVWQDAAAWEESREDCLIGEVELY